MGGGKLGVEKLVGKDWGESIGLKKNLLHNFSLITGFATEEQKNKEESPKQLCHGYRSSHRLEPYGRITISYIYRALLIV